MKLSLISIIVINFLVLTYSIEPKELETFYKDYIQSFGYGFEEHEVTTEDGYILVIWHLTKKDSSPKKVVYFQHGFTCTPWVFFSLKENSLPFLLLENGYDVWLGNSRGTIFSLGHVSKDHTDLNGDYWDYSLDELAVKDLPTTIDYIKKSTSQEKILYIGHSQGTCIFFMLYRHNPTYVENSIEKFVGLGVVPSLTYTNFTPLNILDFVYKAIELSMPITKAIQLNNKQRALFSNICKKAPYVCRELIDTLASTHPTYRIDYTEIYPFMYYYPGGTNSNSLLHWSQIHQEKDLVYFNPNYDKEKECKHYDIEPIKKWKIKAFIQRSDADSFSSYDDVTILYNSIEDKSNILLVDTIDYCHLDELAAESSIQDLYYPIIRFLDNF